MSSGWGGWEEDDDQPHLCIVNGVNCHVGSHLCLGVTMQRGMLYLHIGM